MDKKGYMMLSKKSWKKTQKDSFKKMDFYRHKNIRKRNSKNE